MQTVRVPGRLRVAGLVALALVVAQACGGGGGGTEEAISSGDEVTTTAAPSSDTSAATTAPPTTAAAAPAATAPPTTPAPDPDGPSQSAADAARDGVQPDLAALPLAVRAELGATAATPEGVWAIATPAPAISAHTEGCRLGSIDASYPLGAICTSEYGEILLLDATKSRILRAFPLAGVPPTILEVRDDAVYGGRNGAGLVPDSMVVRIDRTTLASVVRVFPAEESIVRQPCFVPPPNWALDDRFAEVRSLEIAADGVYAQGSGGWTRLDRTTLAVLARDTRLP